METQSIEMIIDNQSEEIEETSSSFLSPKTTTSKYKRSSNHIICAFCKENFQIFRFQV